LRCSCHERDARDRLDIRLEATTNLSCTDPISLSRQSFVKKELSGP